MLRFHKPEIQGSVPLHNLINQNQSPSPRHHTVRRPSDLQKLEDENKTFSEISLRLGSFLATYFQNIV